MVMEAINGGFYLKARKIKDSVIAKAPPHVREIWDWILMHANFADRNNLKRGQLLATYDQIIEDLSWYVGYRKMTYKKHNCETAMKLLTKQTMITTTKTARGMVITVCNYDKYQDPNNYENRICAETKTTREPHENRTKTEERKNEKKEKEGICAGPSVPPSREASSAPAIKHDPIPYAEIIDHLNSRCACQYKHTSQATRRSIKARWAEGFRVDDFKRVVDHKHADWSQDAKMCAFLRPETLFSTKFEGYLQSARNGTSVPFNGGPIPPEQDELLQKARAARAERERKKELQRQQGGPHVS